jgi:hypothetical protein
MRARDGLKSSRRRATMVIYIAIIVAGLGLLVFWGFIGPKKLRDKMKAVDKSLTYDSEPWLPVDVHKPLATAFDRTNSLPSFRERFKRWAYLKLLGFIIAIVVIALLYWTH